MSNLRPIERLRHKRRSLPRLSLGVVAGLIAVMGFEFSATALDGKEDRSPTVSVLLCNHTQASTDTERAEREAGKILGEAGIAFGLKHRKFGWEPPAAATVTVALHDDAHLSPRVLSDARDETKRVYQKAGIKISWIECASSKGEAAPDLRCQDPPLATHLNLRIVPNASKSSDGIFGVAFLSARGTGAYSDVFYDSVVKLNGNGHLGLALVMGHVMAHELGHLLLGLNAHSRWGIMCPSWHWDELRLASMGTLLFSEEQARFMRERLAR
jgi:hypothetical protein